MGDQVSKSEWKKRRAYLDKQTASDKKNLDSIDPLNTTPERHRKAYRAYQSDLDYKNTWSKELGYDSKTTRTKVKSAKKAPKQSVKPVSRKKAARKRG